jgi:hypothetical protein
MYHYDSERLRRVERRPRDGWRRELFGTERFIPENRAWDADDWEAVSRGTGLYTINPDEGLCSSERWRKAYARAYFATGSVFEAVRLAYACRPEHEPAR